MNKEYIDIIWVLIATVFVVAMQGGFLCLESGVTRTKNSINVALKNAVDFTVVICLFWAVGFGLMYGNTSSGWLGTSYFLPSMQVGDAWLATFFIFQAMFCATAATIVSGAIAERVKFDAYIIITILITVLIYPVFGHWAWGGLFTGNSTFLQAQGFVDFAGSTVVHSTGGWIALAAVLVVGPRIGRFVNGEVNNLTASNLPIAMLGLLLFVVGWVGFNGGSTLEINQSIPIIVANTILAAAVGMSTVYAIQDKVCPTGEKVVLPINGALAGMVAVTANCHAVDTVSAIVIAAIGAVIMLLTYNLLLKFKIDDAVGAVPVHLAAGIWGTIAVALFGDLSLLGTGLTRTEQLLVQIKGVVVCGIWSFGVTYILLKNIDKLFPLRVSEEEEHTGLNISEHGEGSPLYELTELMHRQMKTKDLSLRAQVEPFTEVGQIAYNYNKVIGALEQVTRKTRQIVKDIREGIITFTEEGILTSFNPGAERLLQVEAVRVVGKPIRDIFLESGYTPKINYRHGTHDKLQFSMHGSVEFYKEDGKGKFSILEYMPYRGSDHFSESYTAVIRDISEQRHAEEQLFLEKELAQATLESIGEGVITTDEQDRIKYFNDIASEILGISLSDSIGKKLNDCITLYDEQDKREFKLDFLTSGHSNEQVKRFQQLQLHKSDGTVLSVNITSSTIKNKEREIVGSILVVQDISKSKELEELLTHQATHDPLTGLLNRREFESRLLEFSRRSKANDETHVVCYLDLDQFKIVNDTCGHDAGDELLRQLSALLCDKLRAGDTFARLGGDEFGILLSNCDINVGYKIANSIRECVEEFRFPWKSKNFSVGVSIGLVEINSIHNSATEIMSLADAACYSAKDSGRNRVHVHKSDDNELQDRWGQMEWATKIQNALDEDRLCLARQRIIPTADTTMSSRYEMFVRMIDTKGNIIPPGAFIPAAERYSLMTSIDDWVIRHTLQWMQDTDENLQHIAINLSGVSINNKEFLNKLKSYLKDKYVKPEKICFEITETAAISDIVQAKNFFNELKEFGCKFSLDDFGSGLSSFGYLKSLPVDYLKIDGMFVRDIITDPVDRAMVESIHNVGRLMGLQTIAEFVENQEILNMITEIGIDYAQGYHIGKPEMIEAIQINKLKSA